MPEQRINPVPSRAAASPRWSAIAAGALGLGGTWFLLDLVFGTAMATITAGMVVLGVLAALFPGLSDLIDTALTRYFSALLWFAAIFVPVLVARWLADVVAGSPLPLSVMVLAGWLAAFSWMVGGLWTEARRRRVWESLARVGPAAPLVYAFVLAEVAIVLFATLAVFLVDVGAIEFGTAGRAAPLVAEPAHALDFFAWHAIDSIPALGATETLRWDEPLGYEDVGVGALVLVFKVAVIAPIVAAFVAFWRDRRRADA